ncbi:dihydrodipicolinate reductase [Loktanella sp. Alg231-35]|uniref:dihydrodipicolinate reductase n=1 Tax=Loktanella sp. Alg231-35 TaxID=1922220 RepID=UPI000D554A7C|nr:dihydrodipicolinate reductase [Loktanella sp. Alg231-35]
MNDEIDWLRVNTAREFRECVTGRVLTGDGLKFIISPDGKISGTAGGKSFSGAWVWRDGFFCRTAELEGEDLGADCEVIEVARGLMRYTRDKGTGPSAIVDIGDLVSE